MADLIQQLCGQLPKTVQIPTAEVHMAVEKLDELTDRIAALIDRQMDEIGVESVNEAVERSPAICDNYLLLGLIDDAVLPLRRAVEAVLPPAT